MSEYWNTGVLRGARGAAMDPARPTTGDAGPRLCRECRWAYRAPLDRILLCFDSWRFAQCRRPGITELGAPGTEKLVTGRSYSTTPNFCSVEREMYFALDTCGRDARYFEARKPR